MDMYEDVANELFWAQARTDLGLYEPVSVGLRANWQVVKYPTAKGGGLRAAGLLFVTPILPGDAGQI
jgi:hypothetical protein